MIDNQQELFVVVDENDQVTGFRTRYDCHHDQRLIHRAIDVVLTNSQGDILLQKRSKYKDKNPGRYTIAATGHVAKDEAYEAAAKRELQEELGIETTLTFHSKSLRRMDEETEMMAIFTGKTDGPFTLNTAEVEEIQLVPQKKLKTMKPQLTSGSIKTLKCLSLI